MKSCVLHRMILVTQIHDIFQKPQKTWFPTTSKYFTHTHTHTHTHNREHLSVYVFTEPQARQTCFKVLENITVSVKVGPASRPRSFLETGFRPLCLSFV